MKIDICDLPETKKKKGECNKKVVKDQRAKRGVSIVVHKKHKKFIKNWQEVNERIMNWPKMDMN